MNIESIRTVDPVTAELIEREQQRQRDVLRMIPSENYASAAVLAATGSVLTNKYSEGYPGKRYYQGQSHIDDIERLAIERACALFGADHANVQPLSGAPANLAVYFGLLKQGDTVLSMSLPHGGHLSHGWKITISGKHYNTVQYGVRQADHRIDFDQVAQLARTHRPKMIICGASAYPRTIDFAKFAQIAAEVDALLLADVAHISGLIVGGAHPSPFPHADVVSTTTHKTLRGPRSGLILCKAQHAKAIDRAVFPGLQGGPHEHAIGALAVALAEAATPEFKAYAHQTVANAKALAERLQSHGFELISGGTDNHLLLIDLTNKGLTGKQAAAALDGAGIVGNANSIPFDPRSPFSPSGLRLGTPALTSRGMGTEEMVQIADWIAAVVADRKNEALQARILGEIKSLCAAHPAPGL